MREWEPGQSRGPPWKNSSERPSLPLLSSSRGPHSLWQGAQGLRHHPSQARETPGRAGQKWGPEGARSPVPECGQRGVTGGGAGGEDLRRGGARMGARSRGPRLRKLRFLPDSRPHAERPLQLGSPSPRQGSPTPLTWLGCSACSEDAIFLRPD